MIELPESATLAQQINRTLVGKQIAYAEANRTPHRFVWYTGDPKTYGKRLSGKVVLGAELFSGNLRVGAGDLCLLVSTPVRFHEKGARLPAKHQLLIGFEDGSALTCTAQMWGALFCYKKGHESQGVPEGRLLNGGPSPFESAFDQDYFCRLAYSAEPANMPIKRFLATGQRIPGLGNGVLQDILWRAKIHPKRKLNALSEKDLITLYEAVKSVLSEMARKGGRDTERDLFGHPGGCEQCQKA